ncbi:MAG: PLP-dependent aminotransferase family protein [Geothrix sp.]|uniref:aminotransferase-like domain-containing protein n=1 Tax=Geothrix sp. TaxID=1962974 RepID=UPI0018041F63|nr:PLP-dependent aminotransferase family protein [Geothrix sp.]NWJ42497.1 PLP-dependent aminotransferase family protein [Geothrix sp.]WIL19541.1 MAG: PLP-dependent aminotransferase family protein [Geothrix sp.]
MRPQSLFLTLADAPGSPLYQRIALTLQNAILEGRVPRQTALPGSRVLADLLGVNRRTVIAALQELEAQGWLVTRPNSGTFVADELPSGAGVGPHPGTLPGAQVGFDLPSILQPASMTVAGDLLLEDGAPDPRLAPAEELAKGYQRALRRHGPRILSDRDPLGTPLLREIVAAWVSERHGVSVGPERILITRGSREALVLLAGALFRPGSLAAVENPGNRRAWDIFQQIAKMELRPVTVDAEGMVPSALEAVLRQDRIRVLYLTPRRQFPTTAVLSQERKKAILQLAETYRLAVLEDDYDGEYCYEGARTEPLLSMDGTGQVIHIGSLSRLLAPGLKLGYMVLPPPLIPYLAKLRRSRGELGDPVLEWAVADLIRDGELVRHLRKVRKIYASRRDFLVARLQKDLGDHLEVVTPQGGLSLWLRGREGTDLEAWIQAARSSGLILNPPSFFHEGTPEPAFRMGFAQADERELEEAVTRLEKARRTLGPVAG